VQNVQRGSIISLDLARASHRQAVPRIVNRLRDKGYKFAQLGRIRKGHPIRWDMTLRSGSSGAEVRYLQEALNAKTYPAGKPDGGFGASTLQAVYAFEKVNEMPRDGVVTPAQLTKLATSNRPEVVTKGYKRMINVDISRQVVFEVFGGKVKHTLPMSSGNEEYYETKDGGTAKAHTPRGQFSIERKIQGKREADLGTLYNPLYFVGGYAFHGSQSVPTQPASHGCVRLPMWLSMPFYNRNDIGTFVLVHD
jgi:hypothetical protein